MEHCQDLNIGSSVNVKDSIGKLWDKSLSRGLPVNGKCIGELADSIYGGFKGRCELLTQIWGFFSVPVDSYFEFLNGIRKELEGGTQRPERSLDLTSSQGMPVPGLF